MSFIRAVTALIAMLAGMQAASALDPGAQRGLVFSQTNCASCHAIGAYGESPLPIAPPFRTFHEFYPVDALAEALAEGIVTGHPTMPQWQLDAAHINDLIDYLETLDPAG